MSHSGFVFDILSGDPHNAESELYEEFDPIEESSWK